MNDTQWLQQADDSLTLCKVGELSQLSGVKKQALRRYERIGLLHSQIARGSCYYVYTRQDSIGAGTSRGDADDWTVTL